MARAWAVLLQLCSAAGAAAAADSALVQGPAGTPVFLARRASDVASASAIPAWCQILPGILQPSACETQALPSGNSSSAPSPNATATSRQPAWCKDLPQFFRMGRCHGETDGCQCEDWCSDSPESTQQYNPWCCGCTGHNGTGGTTEPAGGADKPYRDPSGRLYPAWCRYLPEGLQDAACHGATGECRCERGCAGNATNISNSPLCCACGHGHGNSTGNASRPGKEPAAAAPPTSRSRPSWCRDLPQFLRLGDCRGEAEGCKCQDWCEHSPMSTFEYNPWCCGCGAENTTGGANGTDGVNGTGGRGDRPYRDPSGRFFPAWCRYLPDALKDAACDGVTGECRCDDSCSAKNSSKSDSANNPLCCACGLPNATSPHKDMPSSSSSSRNPAWCKELPRFLVFDRCQGEAGGCQCRDWCSDMPSALNDVNPLCCGCAGVNRTAGGGANDTDAAKQPWRDPSGNLRPAWCRQLPSLVQDLMCAGSVTGCKCEGFCVGRSPDNPWCCACGETPSTAAPPAAPAGGAADHSGAQEKVPSTWGATSALVLVVAVELASARRSR